jgi:hypothetical protein
VADIHYSNDGAAQSVNWIIVLARRILGRPSGPLTGATVAAPETVRLPGQNDPTASKGSRDDGIVLGKKAPGEGPGLDEWIRAFDLDKERAQLAQERTRLAEENARLWNELIERNARLDKSARALMQSEQALRENLEREVELIEALLPNIEFLRDSRDVLKDRLKSRRSALIVLRELSVRGELIKGTRVEAARDWLERHFNTGDRPNGRIYYRYSGERCSVLISFKADQTADIRYLQTL